MGIEAEYNRILDIEKQTDGEIKPTDLTKDKQFKTSFLKRLKNKHSIFYTNIELATLKRLNEVVDLYNTLSLEEKQQLAFTYNDLQISPFNYLKR